MNQSAAPPASHHAHVALAKTFFAWLEGLRQTGKLMTLARLASVGGKSEDSSKSDAIAVDGPFTEGKELVIGSSSRA